MMGISQKQEQFAKEYSKLFDAVYRYVRYRITDTDEVGDIVSEVFETAYAALDRFDAEKGSLKQWMFGITKNGILMYFRKKKLQIPLEEIENLLPDERHADADDRFDTKLAVEKIYARLNAEQKSLFALRYIDGLSFDELADCTGRESGALRQMFSRLHRALKQDISI